MYITYSVQYWTTTVRYVRQMYSTGYSLVDHRVFPKKDTATHPISDKCHNWGQTSKCDKRHTVIQQTSYTNKHHEATNVITDKPHNATNVIYVCRL